MSIYFYRFSINTYYFIINFVFLLYNKATIKRCDVQINILEYLKKTVKNFPQKIAIIDKEETITFKDLDIKAKKLATFIAKSNIIK